MYGEFNKNLRFVGFSQAAPTSSQYQSLDYFGVFFLTSNGHIYHLNPLMLQSMILLEEHFSQINIQIQDLIEEAEGEITKKLLRLIRSQFVKSKKPAQNKPGFCEVSIASAE